MPKTNPHRAPSANQRPQARHVDGRDRHPQPPSRDQPRSLPPSPLDRATLTAAEVAALLGVNPKTVYEAAARDQIPHRRLGRRLLFPRTAIEAWLASTSTDRAILSSPTRVAKEQVTR